MKNIWIKHKVTLIMLGYILFIAGTVYGFFLPFVGRIKSESDEIQKKNLDGEIYRQKIVKLRDMEKDITKLKAEEEKLNVFIGADQEVSFIKQLEALAEKTRNEISFKVDDKQSDGSSQASSNKAGKGENQEGKDILEGLSYKKFFRIQINLKGDNQSVADFISGLEGFKNYSNIVGLKLSLLEENSDGSPVSSNIFSYSLPAPGSSEKEAPKKAVKKVGATIDLVAYTK